MMVRSTNLDGVFPLGHYGAVELLDLPYKYLAVTALGAHVYAAPFNAPFAIAVDTKSHEVRGESARACSYNSS